MEFKLRITKSLLLFIHVLHVRDMPLPPDPSPGGTTSRVSGKVEANSAYIACQFTNRIEILFAEIVSAVSFCCIFRFSYFILGVSISHRNTIESKASITSFLV